MPARSAKVPSYCRHKASGQAVVRLRGRDQYLGPYGSPESHEKCARLIVQWRSGTAAIAANNGRREDVDGCLSVNRVLLAYVEFARDYYTKNGQPNQEFDSLKYAMRPLKNFYGHSHARDFGPKDLKSIRLACC